MLPPHMQPCPTELEWDSTKPLDYTLRSLFVLPHELIVEILALLDWRDLCRVNAVCRALHELIQNSLELRYATELGADALLDGPRDNTVPTSQRLQRLFDRRKAWNALEWRQMENVSLYGPCQAYELVGGVFAKSMRNAGGGGHFIARWLPSVDGPGKEIVWEEVGIAMRDFALDPSQDLVAYVEADDSTIINPRHEVVIHFRTISTNKPHPSSTLPGGVLRAPTPARVTQAFIQICGPVVGFFYWGAGPGLLVWDWTRGVQLVAGAAVEGTLPEQTWDFALLSSTTYMLTTLRGPGELLLFDLGAGRLVARLMLPPLQTGVACAGLATHAGPVCARVPEGRPFAKDPAARIHVVTVLYNRDGSRCNLFLRNSTLLGWAEEGMRYIQEMESWVEVEEDEEMALVLEWADWGRRTTRMMRGHGAFNWLRYVDGERVVLPAAPVPATPLEIVRVLDFGVHPRRKADTQPTGGAHIDVFLPSCVPRQDVFAEDVWTGLPYRMLSTTKLYDYSGFMIDEERLVGLKSSVSSQGDIGDIHVFQF